MPVRWSAWLGAGGGKGRGAQQVWCGKCVRRVASKAVDFQTGEDTALLVDKDAAQVSLPTEHEVCKKVKPAGGSGLTLNGKIDAGTAARTTPRSDACQLELWQELLCFWLAVVEHPADEVALGVGKLTGGSGVVHEEWGRST